MDRYEEKLDRIAADIAYMKGKVDEALPSLQKTVQKHEESIAALEVKSENITTKVAMAGGITSFIVAFIVDFFLRR